MDNRAKKALEEAAATLHINTDCFYQGKEYNIVEFCQNHLNLPLEETIKVSKSLIDIMPVVYLTEWDIAKADNLQKSVGDRIRAGISGKNRQGNPNQNTFGNAFKRMTQGVGNFFDTKGSATRNAPMIKVTDRNTNRVQYYAFPDLDLTRDSAGHKKVLDTIEQSLNKPNEGKTAEQVMANSPDWLAAQQNGKAITINTAPADQNKKTEVVNILKALDNTVRGNLTKATKYSFMSNDELTNIKNEIAKAANIATDTIDKANTQAPTNVPQEAATGVEAVKKAEAGSTAEPQQTPNAPAEPVQQEAPESSVTDFYANALGKAPAQVQPQVPEAPAAQEEPAVAPATTTIDSSEVSPDTQFEVGGENPGITSEDLAQAASAKMQPQQELSPNINTMAPSVPLASPQELSAPQPAEGETGVAIPPLPAEGQELQPQELGEPAIAPETSGIQNTPLATSPQAPAQTFTTPYNPVDLAARARELRASNTPAQPNTVTVNAPAAVPPVEDLGKASTRPSAQRTVLQRNPVTVPQPKVKIPTTPTHPTVQ